MAPARTRQADLSPYHVELGVSNDADGVTEPRHVHRGGPPGCPRVHGAIHGNRQHTPTSSENGRARGAISWLLLFHSLALHSWRGLSQSIMGKKTCEAIHGRADRRSDGFLSPAKCRLRGRLIVSCSSGVWRVHKTVWQIAA